MATRREFVQAIAGVSGLGLMATTCWAANPIVKPGNGLKWQENASPVAQVKPTSMLELKVNVIRGELEVAELDVIVAQTTLELATDSEAIALKDLKAKETAADRVSGSTYPGKTQAELRAIKKGLIELHEAAKQPAKAAELKKGLALQISKLKQAQVRLAKANLAVAEAQLKSTEVGGSK